MVGVSNRARACLRFVICVWLSAFLREKFLLFPQLKNMISFCPPHVSVEHRSWPQVCNASYELPRQGGPLVISQDSKVMSISGTEGYFIELAC